jgi:hypothetical protein
MENLSLIALHIFPYTYALGLAAAGSCLGSCFALL